MKIYNTLCIDMQTNETLYEQSYEYHGSIIQCKGGGSGGNPDYAYNARMATIAEQQNEWASEFFNFWQENEKALDEEKLKSQRELLPLQTDAAKQYLTKLGGGLNEAELSEEAAANVQQSFSSLEGERRREFSRMGLDASSPAFASQRSKDLREKAKALAGAKTGARRYADDEQMRRLAGAMGGM